MSVTTIYFNQLSTLLECKGENMEIKEFKGKYFFLSNYYEAPVIYEGIRYTNTEAAFHAQKGYNGDITKFQFSHLSPGEAKRLGRSVKLRKDWEEVKDNYMYEIVKAKFEQNSELLKRLLDTGDALLIEGNDWNDKYWGVCDGEGQNKLGKILMKVREELKENMGREFKC